MEYFWTVEWAVATGITLLAALIWLIAARKYSSNPTDFTGGIAVLILAAPLPQLNFFVAGILGVIIMFGGIGLVVFKALGGDVDGLIREGLW